MVTAKSSYSPAAEADIVRDPKTVRRRGRPPTGRSRARGRGAVRRSKDDSQVRDGNEQWYQVPPQRVKDHAEPEEDSERTEEEQQRLNIYQGFSDIVVHLPIISYRSAMFIRSMDEAYREKTNELNVCCKQLQHATTNEVASLLRKRISVLMQESTEYRAECQAEVAKLQTIVDSHSSVLRMRTGKIEGPSDIAAPDVPKPAEPPHSPPVVKPTSSKVAKPRKRNLPSKPAEAQTEEEDIPIDEDEPLYCYCQRVSFGKMIACENVACEGGEWFHFDCLGINIAPRGKWWCNTCLQAGLASQHFTHQNAKAEVQPSKKDRVKMRRR